MTWQEFKQEEPVLASLGEKIFERTSMVMLGTLRKDGSPRISPVEVLFTEGQLYLGMMWRSQKALDLLRDPRCTVHSATSNRDGSQGDFKMFGKAVEVNDPEARSRYTDAMFEKIGFKPEEPEFHLFSIDVESAALIEFKDEKMTHKVWHKA
ncbi:MAG: hypothetical protein BZY75_02080 [SAR202 cluster bacterium Io17-Chloro-G7]|nr:MAG: hypothetical protein BZY75_02080 [SAR202 cluster bacterium Io17-Chloro-G7]